MTDYEKQSSLAVDEAKDSDLFKCDFCNVSLESDLKVSEHLASEEHINKRDQYVMKNNPRERITQMDMPKSLAQVCQTLKLRNPQDVNILSDKSFFEIPQKNVQLLEVAKQMAQSLASSAAMYELSQNKNLNQACTSIIMDSFLRPRDKGIIHYEAKAEDEEVPMEISSPKKTSPFKVPQQPAQKLPGTPHPATISHRQRFNDPQPIIRQQDTLMPGTSGASNQSRLSQDDNNDDDSAPQPRLDSTYKPRLAKIKVETQDQ